MTFQKKAKRNVQRKFPEEEVAFEPGSNRYRF